MTESETVGWNHEINGREFEHTQGDSERQGGLVCCCSVGCKELYMTEKLNNNNITTLQHTF